MKLAALVVLVVACHAKGNDSHASAPAAGVYCDRARGVVHAPAEDREHGIVRCAADLECCATTEPGFRCGDPHASVWTSCLPLVEANAH